MDNPNRFDPHRSAMKRFLLFLLLTLPAVAEHATAQQAVTIRVCTYNVLNFGTPTQDRATELALVLLNIRADILVLHEIAGETGYQNFQSMVLGSVNSLNYTAAPFTDGPDTDDALLYDSTKVTVIHHDTIASTPRIFNIWTLSVKGVGDTIVIIGCHLKAGETSADAITRGNQIADLRRGFGPHPDIVLDQIPVVFAGDLNTYSSKEDAYRQLTFSGPPLPVFVDPIHRPGDWHDNSTFADIMTQSPRVRQFGGGISGGMDDRFDFLLLSDPALQHYNTGSYTAFGNDGHHFNDSINHMPNTVVDSVTAQALHDASDHLPVYLDLVFGGASGVEERRRVPVEMDLTKAQ